MKFYPVVVPFFLTAIAASVQAYAEDVVELPETVITATKVPTPKTGLAALTTVITAEEIQKSPAQNLITLLASQAGVNVRSLDGSSNGSVDLGGFGSTGLSNTLILIDGVAQNENDLSAPRISQVPLESIARIEIVRGSGAVQYGGGATGGVVNIITKGAMKKAPKVTLLAEVGSKQLKHVNANVTIQSDVLGWNVIADRYDNDHFRDNNHEARRSVQSTLSWRGDKDKVDLKLAADDGYLRLPGSLSYDELQSNRWQSVNPNDWSELHSQQQQLSYSHDGNGVQVLVDAAHRSKHASFDQSSYFYENFYGADSINPRMKWTLGSQASISHSLVLGYDYLRNFNNGYNKGLQHQNGIYLNDVMSFANGGQVSAGIRQQYVKDELKTKTLLHHLNAWELAGSIPVGQDANAFASLGKSFRVANADEQGYTIASKPLLPQTSNDYQFGAEWKVATSNLKASYFYNDVNNEIHYNPLANSGSGANVNLPPTRHQGLRLEFGYRPIDAVKLTANAVFQRAQFKTDQDGASIGGRTIPLVPRRLLNLGMTWQLNAQTAFQATIQHVSSQYMDGNETNSSSIRNLPAYTLTDIAVMQQWKEWGWKFSVNNAFNKKYVTYATNGWSGEAYYPGAGRSAVFSLNYQFQ